MREVSFFNKSGHSQSVRMELSMKKCRTQSENMCPLLNQTRIIRVQRSCKRQRSIVCFLVTIGDNHILIIFSFIMDNYQNNRGKLPLYVLLCLIIAETTSNYLNNRASSLTLILVTIGDRTTHGAGNMQIEKLWDSKK